MMMIWNVQQEIVDSNQMVTGGMENVPGHADRLAFRGIGVLKVGWSYKVQRGEIGKR
jgi:hypothetical protein